MAVTFHQVPVINSFQSSDDPIVYVFSSNMWNQPNFSFVVNVFLNNVITEVHMVFPERANGTAMFSASLSVKAQVSPVQRTNTFVTGETAPTLRIAVQERYGTVPVTQGTQYNSGLCKLIKASTDEESFSPGWLAVKYTPSVRWLTNVPGPALVHKGNAVWCSILNVNPQTQVTVEYYNASGENLGQGSSGILPNYDRLTVMIDDAVITSHIGAGLLSSVASFNVYMNQSQAYAVKRIEASCSEPTQLSWKNNVGGHDNFVFTHNRERVLNTEIREFKKQFGNWNGNAIQFVASNSGTVQYLKVTEPSGTIHSGWVSESFQNWLAELYQSVDVVAVAGTALEKIPVTSTKTTIDKNRFTDIMNFSVSYTKSNFKSINI